jgi:DNA-binding NtrC family response regulator
MKKRGNGSSRKVKVLVVDDDPTMRDVLELRLARWGFQVVVTGEADGAAEVVRREDPDIVLSDVVMPGLSGLDLLRALKESDPDRPVILLTAHGTVERAVEAMKSGALDFLTKPLDYSNLKAVLDQAIRDTEGLARSANGSENSSVSESGFGHFIGKSRAMLEAYDLIRSVGEREVPVLITGESGTGKELAARMIHESGTRKSAAFVALNAAAIPRELVESEIFGHVKGAFTGATQDREGCFEMAAGGTLFLDEIGEMPMELQPKLLRVLDEAKFRRVGGQREISVDVRVISATNVDPAAAVRDRAMREDLYYRLSVVTLPLPPLREREGDIERLSSHFLGLFAEKHSLRVRAIRDEALALLEAYHWPGNVRELRNVMERAVVVSSGEWIEPSHLPAYVRNPVRKPSSDVLEGGTVAETEKRLILQTLEATGNNKTEAARRLGLNVKTIRNKMRSYGLDS